MHLTVVIRLCVELINVNYDLSDCERENAERSPQREPTHTHSHTFQLCVTFRPITIIAFSGFKTPKGVVSTLCNVIAAQLQPL